MPDGTAIDTVAVETCLTQSIAPVAATPWGMTATLLPHPTCLFEIYPTDGASATAPFTIRNPMFASTLANGDIGVLLSQAEEWRLTAMSVTIHLDANATKDSGTVVAAQIPVKPNIFWPGSPLSSGAITDAYPAIFFDTADQPTYGQMLQMPRAYQSNLRTGLYMPLRLSNTSQHWHSRREVCKLIPKSVIANIDVWDGTCTPYMTTTSNTPAWPNWDLTPAHRDVSNECLDGGCMSAFLGDNFGRIAIKNVDPSSAVVIKIKCGLELKVGPTSPQATHLQKAPAMDAGALATYFALSRQLPDAYPADYNDGGKILNAISKALKFMAPMISAVPGIGTMLSNVVGPSTVLLDYGADRLKQRKQRKAEKRRGAPKAPPPPRTRKELYATPVLIPRRRAPPLPSR